MTRPVRTLVRWFGLVDYAAILVAMRAFTKERVEDTEDAVWALEHEPVFTHGRAGRTEHLHDPGDIPVVRSDRGGQVTYHGPGQLIVYPLLDIRRAGLSVRCVVHGIERAVIALLAGFGIAACAKADAPGVYVEDAKIASLGLRVQAGRTLHGVALNVCMDLSPFSRIDPCGYAGLRMTQLKDLGVITTPHEVATPLVALLLDELNLGAACWLSEGSLE
ncbi:MAG: lipoyl(octanoyl) transferase LipB [Gammaproteobacteria bacterium]|nr:lipoyl(octanoyl) transferase LipB [Gammaproteobacteria bacterium]